MEVLNYNKMYREYISNYFRDIDQFDEIKTDKTYEELLSEFKVQKNYKAIICTLYTTSLMVNYTTKKMLKDDADAKNEFDYIYSFKTIDDVINNMDIVLFKKLCSDVITFDTADYYTQKRYVMDSLDIKDKFISMSPLYMLDIVDYSQKLDTTFITNALHYDNGDEIGEVEKKIITHYSSDQLIKLEENDPDNYKEMLKEIIDIYYRYNTYKESIGTKLDYETTEIMKMIEDDSIYYVSVGNMELLKRLVGDFIEYKLLYLIEKEEVDAYRKPDPMFKKRKFVNKNDKVREKVMDIYAELDDAASEEAYYQLKDLIFQELMVSDDLEEIEKIMYNDAMSIICSDYYGIKPEDVEEEYRELINLESFDEFRDLVEENQDTFFDYLDYVKKMYRKNLLERKDMIVILIDSKSYKKFLIHQFLPDFMEANIDYDLSDTVDIYDNEFMMCDNKEDAIHESIYTVYGDIDDLTFIAPDNYNRLIRKILEVYYMYAKFLSYKGLTTPKTETTIMKMEEDLDSFIASLENDYDTKWEILYFYYEYVSLEDYEKDRVKKCYKDLDTKGKIKIFGQKNKNSD